MNTRRITHPLLEKEYYYCEFRDEADAKAFKQECEWFDYEDITLNYPEKCVLEYDKDTGYFEKLNPVYFKNTMSKEIEVKTAVLGEAHNFFR